VNLLANDCCTDVRSLVFSLFFPTIYQFQHKKNAKSVWPSQWNEQDQILNQCSFLPFINGLKTEVAVNIETGEWKVAKGHVMAKGAQSGGFCSDMALCLGTMLATFVIVLSNPRKQLIILVANGLTQAPSMILCLKKVSWAFSLASIIKEILRGLGTLSCLYLARWLLCKLCPYLSLIIQEYVEYGLGLEVSHESGNSIVKWHSFPSAEGVMLSTK